MLADRCIALNMRILLITGLISCIGCAATRKADLHDPTLVNRIDLYQRQGSQIECVGIIDNRDNINNIVAQVNSFQQGWKPVLVTAPSGQLRIIFRANRDALKGPVFYIAVCPREIGGEIVTDIGDTTCSRDVSQIDLDQLLAALDLKQEVLDKAK
jgi:hypothetical protein